MTHEETTLQTKKALAASLKKHMAHKKLQKITVTEIIKDCNVNRKTFYYHFQDIYALLKWILEEEAVNIVKQFDLLIDYKEAILFIIDYVESNAHLLACAYDSIGREEMKHFFFADFIGIMHTIVDGTEQQLELHVTDDFKDFLCCLYTEALSEMLINCFKEHKNCEREKAMEYLSLIIYSSLPEVLKNAPALPHSMTSQKEA